jgi:hypothetical protein
MHRPQSSIRKTPTVPRVELKPRRPWQSYVLAVLMVFVGLIAANSLFGSSPEPSVAQSSEEKTQTVEVSAAAESSQSDTSEVASEPFFQGAPAEVAPQPSTASAVPENAEVVSAETQQVESVEESAWVGPPEATDNEVAQDDVETARGVVDEFYSNLDTGNISRAYDKLSPDFREVLSYRRFNQGYSQTESLTCEIKHSEQLSPDKVRLDVALAVVENGVPTEYLATCVVAKTGDDWGLAGVVQLENSDAEEVAYAR